MSETNTDSFVGRYRPLLELGRGGMARVYLAESLGSGMLRKLVVVKALNPELAADEEMRRSFIREAEISSRLNHPNIVNVHEVFEQGSTAVMVMQYLEGMPLSEILSRLKGVIPLKLHITILCQLLDALHYFHELKDTNGVSLECVHRDVSPDNVMVLHEGGIKVVDFGVAKVRVHSENHTRAGVIKGKVAYMPPEQLLASASVDRRADIYSVGVMLWEAVAGRRMWRGMDASARMRAIVKGEIPDIRQVVPSISNALANIVARALAHTPDGRYATAEEMQIELEEIAMTEGGHTAPRELAEFMRTHFGEERREKQREIEKVVSDRHYSLAGTSWSVTASASGTALASGPHERSSVQAALVAPSVTMTARSRWRRPLVGSGLVVAACLAIAAIATSGPSQPEASSSESVAAAPVTIRVDSDRAGADVYVDGVKVGVTPLVQTRPASAQPATIELRAEGRTIESKVVSLRDDVALHFAMHSQAAKPTGESDPSDAPEEPSAEPQKAAPEPSPAQDRPSIAGRPRRPAPRPADTTREKPTGTKAAPEIAAPPAPAPSAPAKDSCDPPYRLDPGGVKVFKSHCF